MKRKKLGLTRQTIQRLDPASLVTVVGGGKTSGFSSEWTQGINCGQSEYTYCGCDLTWATSNQCP